MRFEAFVWFGLRCSTRDFSQLAKCLSTIFLAVRARLGCGRNPFAWRDLHAYEQFGRSSIIYRFCLAVEIFLKKRLELVRPLCDNIIIPIG